jgi:hypothetical protein
MTSHQESIALEELHIHEFTGAKGRILKTIIESQAFRNGQSFREQRHVADDFRETYYKRKGKQLVHPLSRTDPGTVFGAIRASVENQLSKSLEKTIGEDRMPFPVQSKNGSWKISNLLFENTARCHIESWRSKSRIDEPNI